MPIANTAKKMKELKPGQVLEVLADDAGHKTGYAQLVQDDRQ